MWSGTMWQGGHWILHERSSGLTASPKGIWEFRLRRSRNRGGNISWKVFVPRGWRGRRWRASRRAWIRSEDRETSAWNNEVPLSLASKHGGSKRGSQEGKCVGVWPHKWDQRSTGDVEKVNDLVEKYHPQKNATSASRATALFNEKCLDYFRGILKQISVDKFLKKRLASAESDNSPITIATFLRNQWEVQRGLEDFSAVLPINQH